MSKSIGRVFGTGSMSPYGYETDYMQYLQGYNPYNYEQTLQNMMPSAVNVNVQPDYQLSVQTTATPSERAETADTFSEKPEEADARLRRMLNKIIDNVNQMNAYKESLYQPYNGYEWNVNSYDVPQIQSSNIPQLKMPADAVQQIKMRMPQKPEDGSMLKQWAENTGDAMQAGAVGYTTGATLGNFDEAMGAATAAVTFNPNNYAIGRDATRQLQEDLQKRHPYIYGGAEFVGAMTTPMHLVKDTAFTNKAFNALTDTISASTGYAENADDFVANLAVNGMANGIGLKVEQLPMFRAIGNNIGKWMAKNGPKFIKQGINSFADKMKNMFYSREEENY